MSTDSALLWRHAMAKRRLLELTGVAKRGTEQDVRGAYNSVFTSLKHTGRRTSLIVDPPDGRIPPVAPDVQKRRAEFRVFELALLQPTDVCKNKLAGCAGGQYGP